MKVPGKSQLSWLPLVAFRVIWGLLMAGSLVRFVAKGWVGALFLEPRFHFTYLGFGWVRPLPAPWLYALFGALILLTLAVAAGAWYRASIIGFFLGFTYIELLDKSLYLNHYYFVSLVSFLMIWLPLHRWGSVDAWRAGRQSPSVPPWILPALRFQVGLVYVFAGLAKVQGDWLAHALPLRIWLPAHADLPLLGPWLAQPWLAFGMSWAGALYDLTIPFWLLHPRTRRWAYATVIIFHALTALLFPIGMFPWIMIAATLIFFPAESWVGVLGWVKRLVGGKERESGRAGERESQESLIGNRLKSFVNYNNPHEPSRAPMSSPELPRAAWIVGAILVLQLLIPLRHWLYPGDARWTEEGYRFAWNVMLVEKTGVAIFTVRDPVTGREWVVHPREFLAPHQEKQMSFQPDMLQEFAHFLDKEFRRQGYPDVEVRAEAWVAWNGRASRPLVDPTIDLSAQPLSLAPKPWILPAPTTQ